MKNRVWALGVAGLAALAGSVEAQSGSRVGFGKSVGSFRQSSPAGAARAPISPPSRVGFGGGDRDGRGQRQADRRGGDNHDGYRSGGNRGTDRGNWDRGGHRDGGSRTSVSISIGAGFGSWGREYCPPPRRPVFIDRCDPFIVRRPIVIDPCPPVYVRRPIIVDQYPSVIVQRPIVVVERAPSVITVRGEPAAPEYITQEEWCWRALATGNPEAMETFGDLVARGNAPGIAELGYAICAAAAGQIERADWAASKALQVDAEIGRKVPRIPGLKDQIVSALKNYTSLATEPTPQRAQTIALFKDAIGDAHGAEQARAAMARLQEYAAAKAAPAPTELASAK
ncbi:MAG: hypothetical protein IT437_07180 [Phycisphaerales bacterium]|nr:hypothetical protein [Phycisphaerales bacterium]